MTRGKPLSFDRSEVLGRAMDYFWTHGYEATGMTELLNHLGIQRQSFYNSFESKGHVFQEAIEFYSSGMLDRLQGALRSGKTPIESIKNVFKFWESLGESGDCRGCLLGNAVAEFGATDEKITKMVQKNLRAVENAFHKVFKQAIDEGFLPKDRDPRVQARTMLTCGQGLALMSKTGMSIRALKEVMKNMERSLLM